MREHEMRARIESALRKAAVPAGVGITMALAGCSSDDTTGGMPVKYGTVMVLDSGTSFRDATLASPTPLYMAVMPDAGAKDSPADGADAGPTDAKSIDDASPPFPIYMAMIPDPGVEGDGG